MSNENLVPLKPSLPEKDQSGRVTAPVDPRQRALAIALEFTKRCFEARTLDDLHLLLTNDVRALVPFDRAVLVTHMGGDSRFVAAGNQPMLDSRSKFQRAVSELAPLLRDLRRGVLLSGRADAKALGDQDISQEAKEALQSYIAFSRCAYLFVVPFNHNEVTVAHLVLEFLDDKVPDEIGILTLLNIAPFLAAALTERWLLVRKPGLSRLVDPAHSAAAARKRWTKFLVVGIAVIAVLLAAFFLVPFPFDVGGEAEVVPTERHVAFCKIDGLIETVKVTEGAHVESGQVLATLDPRELDFKVKAAESQFEVLTSEMVLLRSAAGEAPSKLAESKVVELKRKGVWEEGQFLKWQQQFLRITAPVGGVILTRDIETLAGKKLRAGEPFCEIAVPGEFSVDVFVPEDRIGYVKTSQRTSVYLSANPRHSYELAVSEIAPISEASQRLGNAYRVRCPFPHAPSSTLVGMKGIGKIHVMDSTLWFVATDRLLSRWQRWSLWF